LVTRAKRTPFCILRLLSILCGLFVLTIDVYTLHDILPQTPNRLTEYINSVWKIFPKYLQRISPKACAACDRA